METGVEVEAGYQITNGLKITVAVRKSVLTNLTENKRLDSHSPLPRVHSSWPLYDIAGQSGHIYELTMSYMRNLAPSLYGRAHAGLLEPFFAGVGGELPCRRSGQLVLELMSISYVKETTKCVLICRIMKLL